MTTLAPEKSDELRAAIRESIRVRRELGDPPDPESDLVRIGKRPAGLRWRRGADGLILDDWAPDTIRERDERLAWLVAHRRPWKLLNGHLISDPAEIARTNEVAEVAGALSRAMAVGRTTWNQKMRELGMSGAPLGAEGTYGALGAYPLAGELASVTPTTTEAALITAANAAIFMPLPANGILGPQAYRFMVGARVTTSATAANYTWTPRLGNANTSPSLGASAAIAKTISITNAMLIWKGDITLQTIGVPGANSKAVGHFDVKLNSAAGGAYTSWAWGSAAAASFDSSVSGAASVNGGIVWLGATASAAASDPFIVGQIHFMDWN